MKQAQNTVAQPQPQVASVSPVIAAFVCENCARGGVLPRSGVRRRPTPLQIAWPAPAQEVVVPCAGRLQPEHLLKAFESGVYLVAIVACQESNCHYLEGCTRAQRRVEYTRNILSEIGLAGDRLMLFHLPGSAGEDMVLGAGGNGRSNEAPGRQEEIAKQQGAIVAEVAQRLKSLKPNSLRSSK